MEFNFSTVLSEAEVEDLMASHGVKTEQELHNAITAEILGNMVTRRVHLKAAQQEEQRRQEKYQIAQTILEERNTEHQKVLQVK